MTKRIVAIVPLKEKSQRLPGKNLALLGGKPLYQFILQSLLDVEEIQKIHIYSSSELFQSPDIDQKNTIEFKRRSSKLDADDISINQILKEYLLDTDADIVVLAHATSPFLKAKTISNCINAVLTGKNDSALAAIKLNKFAIFNGNPINFIREKNLPPLQEIEPVIIEQGGLYVFRKENFLKTNSRVGTNPHFEFINVWESADIDTLDDFKLSELILEFSSRS